MRIAILDCYPRVSGVTTYIWQLRTGMRALGHDCQIITPTKSGKASVKWGGAARNDIMWWPHHSDVYCKWSEAPSLLNTYDLIVLPEPHCQPLDGEDDPLYIATLRQTRTPWCSYIHGPHYAKSKHVAKLLETGTCLGMCATQKWHITEQFKHVRTKVMGTLPYLPIHGDAPPSMEKRLGYVGRLSANKGIAGLVLLAEIIAQICDGDHWYVDLHGSCVVTMGGSYAHSLYERLKRRGYVGLPLNTKQPIPWRLARGNITIEYHGGYVDTPTPPCAVLLTDVDSQRGMLEYAALECIDAGSLMVVPENQCSDDYGAVRMIYKHPPRFSGDGKLVVENHREYECYEAAAHTVCNVLCDADLRAVLAEQGRECLKLRHDPADHARRMLEFVFDH